MTQHAIATAGGASLCLANPRPGAVLFADIAHALSQINRFTGHAVRPYSVAEHSLLVCEIVEREFGLDLHAQLAALMHDAHEAYVSDVSTPAKRLVGEEWYQLERRHERMVRSCFALHVASTVNAAFIKQADLMALATERAQLLSPGEAWDCLEGITPIGWVDLMAPERQAMTWRDWRTAFTDRYLELDFARSECVNALAHPSTDSR